MIKKEFDVEVSNLNRLGTGTKLNIMKIKLGSKVKDKVSGFTGIGTLIYAGFAYGIELPIILFLVVISNNLCNVK